MNNLQEYKLSLFERCEAGDITVDERDLLLEAVSDEIDVDEMDNYEESVLERFEAGLLTEEETAMLLEATRYAKEQEKKRELYREKRKHKERAANAQDIKSAFFDFDKENGRHARKAKKYREEAKERRKVEEENKGGLYYGRAAGKHYGNAMKALREKEIGTAAYELNKADHIIDRGKAAKKRFV
jgi:hypothetical protein